MANEAHSNAMTSDSTYETQHDNRKYSTGAYDIADNVVQSSDPAVSASETKQKLYQHSPVQGSGTTRPMQNTDDSLIGKRNRSTAELTESKDSDSRTAPKRAKVEADKLMLAYWFERERRIPEGPEVHSLAMVSNMSSKEVMRWFQAKWTTPDGLIASGPPLTAFLSASSRSDPISTTADTLETLHTSTGSSSLAIHRSEEDKYTLVRAYCSDRTDREGCHAATRSRRNQQTNGRYECTRGCTYKTKRKDDWEKHEKINFPQEFWVLRGLPIGPTPLRNSPEV